METARSFCVNRLTLGLPIGFFNSFALGMLPVWQIIQKKSGFCLVRRERFFKSAAIWSWFSISYTVYSFFYIPWADHGLYDRLTKSIPRWILNCWHTNIYYFTWLKLQKSSLIKNLSWTFSKSVFHLNFKPHRHVDSNNKLQN